MCRNLRGRLYRESYEFVRSQRIACLHEGAWFRAPRVAPPSSSRKPPPAVQKVWRFYRLAANRRVLHFVETSERVPIRGGLDDLPERSASPSCTLPEIFGADSIWCRSRPEHRDGSDCERASKRRRAYAHLVGQARDADPDRLVARDASTSEPALFLHHVE